LKETPVAKSTLSLWLRNVGLTRKQKQRLTEKRLIAALGRARAKKEQRLATTKEIKEKARNEVGKLSNLYWAEGLKEKRRKNSSIGI